MIPVVANPAPSRRVASQPPPKATVTSAATNPSRIDPMHPTATATTRRLDRPSTPAASNSAWPESSCARLARVTANIAPIAARNPPSARLRQALKPSVVLRS